MKKLLLPVAITMIIAVCEGCNEKNELPHQEAQTEVTNETGMNVPEECFNVVNISEAMKEKAAQFRNSAHKNGVGRNGVYVYSKSVDKYKNAPEQLAARIKVLGFDEVYLSPGKSKIVNRDQWLRTFISTLKGYQINTHALRISDINIFVDETLVDKDVDLIKSYNEAVSPNERFSGIAADLEPHLCKKGKKPAGLPYTWSNDDYHPGGDNENLLRLTFERLERANSLLSGQLQLSEAIFWKFQDNAEANNLSYGKTSKFLEVCDWVVVMAYKKNGASAWAASESSVRDAATVEGKTKTVSICIKTLLNGEGGALEPYTWSNLLETAEYIVDKGKSYASFRGLDIFTYAGIEAMWEEEE